jgi:hypothetical protein
MSQPSAFAELGFSSTIDGIVEEIIALYCVDEIPWVVGYSGGKDSSAVLSLVWTALAKMEAAQRTKPVYVISPLSRTPSLRSGSPTRSRRWVQPLPLRNSQFSRIDSHPMSPTRSG